MARLLIVEHDSTISNIYCLLFRGHGVDLTQTGQAAMEAVSKRKYDLIIQCLRLPQFSGIEVLRCIRNSPANRETPVFIITTCVDPGLYDQAQEMGIQLWLTKPFRPAMLLEQVEVYLGQSPSNPQGDAILPAPGEPGIVARSDAVSVCDWQSES